MYIKRHIQCYYLAMQNFNFPFTLLADAAICSETFICRGFLVLLIFRLVAGHQGRHRCTSQELLSKVLASLQIHFVQPGQGAQKFHEREIFGHPSVFSLQGCIITF